MGRFCFLPRRGEVVGRGVLADGCVAQHQMDGDHDIAAAEKGLAREFSRTHAMCIHLNLVTVCATVWYGWRLAMKLDFGGNSLVESG